MIMEVRHELSESVIGFDGIELLEDESTVWFLILGRVFRFLIHPDNYKNRYDKDNNSKWNPNDSSSWMSGYDIG